MKINWEKVVSVAIGAGILALQGVNINETSSIEGSVERSETSLVGKIYNLEKRLADMADRQEARVKALLNKLDIPDPATSPSPTPTSHQ